MNKKYIITAIKKKPIIVAVVLIISVALCTGGFFIYRAQSYLAREQHVIKKWNLVLPEKRVIKYAMRIYHMDGHDSYTVYKLKQEPAAFLDDFSQGKYPSLEEDIDEIITAVKNGGWLAPPNKIPKKYLPDWSEDYYLKYENIDSWDCYYMVYFPGSSLLFICDRYYR